MSIKKRLGFAGKWCLPGAVLALAAVVIMTTTLALPGAAWGFVGGDGTGGSPYQIATPEQLDNVRNDLSAHYVMIENIDLSVHLATYYEDVGWVPIGNFTGTFDGDGYTISNLFINRSGTNNVGLFGYTGAGAEIRNLGLEDVEITGRAYVGGLVGNNKGTITNSYVTGTVESSRLDLEAYTGGLVGWNNGDITNSYTTSNVKGYVTYVGGLVGYNEGNITNSYATRNVTSSGDCVGGLVGLNYNGTISNSYATGDVTGSSSVGGLVGKNSNSTISYSYAAGAVTGSDLNRVGGLVGVKTTGTIASSYYNWCTTGQSQYDNSKGIPKSSTEMVQIVTFSYWNFSGTWSIKEGKSYPYLQWSNHVPAPPTATGVIVSPSALDFTYGDASTYLTASVEPTCAIQTVNWSTSNSNVAAVDENGVVTPVGAGEATITATTTTGGVIDQITVTVSKKELTVSGWFAENKEYDGKTDATTDDNQLELEGIVDGDDVFLNAIADFADAYVGNGKTVSLTDASSLSGADADNYSLSLTGAPTNTANITPKKLTVTAEDKSKTYGAADPEFTVTYDGFITGEDESAFGGVLLVNRAPGEDAGSYAITPAGLTSNNYAITFKPGAITITVKELTVTAEDKSKTHGAADPEFTVTYDGFITGEDESALGGELSFTRAPGEDAGTYTITPAGLAGANYHITFIDGTLTITAASGTTSRSNGGSSSSPAPDPEPDEDTVTEETEPTPAPVAPKRAINLTIGATEGTLDGAPYTLDAAPLVRPEVNRTLVPIRFISEALGARVEWLEETQEVIIREVRNGQQVEIILTIDSEEALMNGVPVTLDCAAEVLLPGRTFVPLRFVSENAGCPSGLGRRHPADYHHPVG